MSSGDVTEAGCELRVVRSLAQAAQDNRGSIVPLFALFLVPLVAIAGVAIDFTRGNAVRSQLQSAADTAVLSARGTSDMANSAVEARAVKYFEENAKRLLGATVKSVKATKSSDNIVLEAKVDMQTTLSKVLGIKTFEIDIRSKAMSDTGEIEVALVLDNTGSMKNDMGNLKQAAKDLVNALHGGSSSSSMVNIAVVPYVGAVNIGNGVKQMNWMDTVAAAQWHGEGLEWWAFGYEKGCIYTPSGGGGGGGGGPGTGTTGSLQDRLPKFAELLNGLFGIASAHAATAADVPAAYYFSPDCWIVNRETNYFDLFAKIPNAPWKGCVLARAEPYDVTDDPPNPATPNTMFVPWFWPDQADAAVVSAQGQSWTPSNDYLPDRWDLQPPVFNDNWYGWRNISLYKYNNTPGVIVETGPDTSGPNKACPDPILPLTNSKSDVLNKIDGLTHWNGSGTNSAEGVAWGWRVLSPGEPFSEGKPYGKIKKVMVLMTDGINNVDPDPDWTLSHMSAYGMLHMGRIQPATYAGFKDYADQRMLQTCSNAKATGIEIYTVAFNVSDSATLSLLSSCATKPPYAFTASTADELVQAFGAIAQSLTQLRIAE